MNILNWISGVLGVIGGVISGLLGGFDSILITLVTLVIIDYLTGIIKAVFNKNISSSIGFKGIIKKIMVFIVVCMAHTIQSVIGTELPIREIVIMFFIANEGISILENAGEFIPIPEQLREVIEKLRGKNDK
jgi:toxin secretion/phage lysis holin